MLTQHLGWKKSSEKRAKTLSYWAKDYEKNDESKKCSNEHYPLTNLLSRDRSIFSLDLRRNDESLSSNRA